MTTARRLAGDSLWLLGAQVAVMLVQFGFAAVTARAVSPSGFGQYAVALGLAGVLSLFTSAGVAGAAARMPDPSEGVVRGLGTVAAVLGLISAGIAAILAGPWARLWGVPEATATVRWAALPILTAPYLALLGGLSRRFGRTRPLAVASFAGAAAGMLLALPAVLVLRSPPTLLLSGWLSAVIQVVLLDRVLNGAARPHRTGSQLRPHLAFAGQVTGASVLSYLARDIPIWGLSRAVGPADLGAFNRAVVLVQVPLENLQRAVTQVLYPEFRHDTGAAERARRLWPDLMELVAWVTLPVAAAAAAAAPALVAVVLGPGWSAAAQFAPWLAIAAGLAPATIVLSAALEASDRLKHAWGGLIASVAVAVGGALVAMDTGSSLPILVALAVIPVVRHVFQVMAASRANMLSAWDLSVRYARVALLSLGLAMLVWAAVVASETMGVAAWIGAAVGLGGASACLLWLASSAQSRMSRLLRRYGIRH